MNAAYAAGVRLFDTADVYGDGDAESERSVGRFLKGLNAEQRAGVFVATKLGRNGIYPDGYTRDSLRAATDASRERLGVDTLDLTQLHCIPHDELRKGDVFDWLREQRDAGLIARFGASVESCEEGLTCLEQEGLSSLQVIFNVFRQKPLEALLPRAQELGVAVIVRLPLASGLLTGKLTRETTVSPRVTTATSTATGPPSTSAKPSPACPTTRAGALRSRAHALPRRRARAPGRPALDPRPRRGHGRHPRGQLAGAGREQRRRVGPRPAGRDRPRRARRLSTASRSTPTSADRTETDRSDALGVARRAGRSGAFRVHPAVKTGLIVSTGLQKAPVTLGRVADRPA